MQRIPIKKFRLVSWNVNGFRAALSKGIFTDLGQMSPDVLCFQEIKMKEEQLPAEGSEKLEKYLQFWNSAERPGYSGVATFSKEIPLNVELSMGAEEFDIEGRFINLDFGDFNLINVYVPNGKRNHTRLSYKLNFYDKLLQICDELHAAGKLIVIVGILTLLTRR